MAKAPPPPAGWNPYANSKYAKPQPQSAPPPPVPTGGNPYANTNAALQQGRGAPPPAVPNDQTFHKTPFTGDAAKSEVPALPQGQEAPHHLWLPFIDPNRTASDRSPLLFRTDGQDVNLGDIAPNIQDILRPVFRPRDVIHERGGAATMNELRAASDAARPYTNLNNIAAHPFKALAAAGQVANVGQRLINPESVPGAIAAGVAGLPSALIQGLNVGAQGAEDVIGTVSQQTGLPLNRVGQVITGRAIAAPAPFFMRGAAQVVDMLGNHAAAQQILDSVENLQPLPASVSAEFLANAIVRAREAGIDSKPLEQLLEGLAPYQDREALIKTQKQLVDNATGYFVNDPAAVWYSSEYGYESTAKMMDARLRLQAGESWDTIGPDLENQMTAAERTFDLGGKIVLDPLHGKELLTEGGVTAARMGKWYNPEAMRMVISTLEDNGLKLIQHLEEANQIVKGERPIGNRVITWLFERTRPSVINRTAEEGGQLMEALQNGIAVDASQRLAQIGIAHTPEVIMLEAFLNPKAENLLKTGRSAEELRTLIGLGSVELTAEQAARMKVPAGSIYDLFNSDAADRLRYTLTQMKPAEQTKFLEQGSDLRKTFQEVYGAGKITLRDKDGVETVLQGQDAIEHFHQQLAGWLDTLSNTIETATGYEPPKGIFTNIQKAAQKYNSLFAQVQIAWSWGTSWRNLFNNDTVLGLLDGVDIATKPAAVRRELAELGVLSTGFDRGGVALFGDTVKTTGLLGKLTPGALMEMWERGGRARAMLHGFNGFWGQEWRFGRAIPEAEWALIERDLGDLGPSARAMLENARSPEDFQSIRRMLSSGDTWRALDSTLMREAHEAGLGGRLNDLYKVSTRREEFLQRADELMRELDAAHANLPGMVPPVHGTPGGEVANAADMMLAGLSPAEREKYFSDFWQERAKFDAGFNLARAHAEMALNALEHGEQRGQLGDALRALMGKRMEAHDPYRITQIKMTGAIHAHDWAALEKLDPLFMGVKSEDLAKSAYYLWGENYWREVDKSILPGLVDITRGAGGDVASVEQKLAQVENFIPATPQQQKVYWNQILNRMDAGGFRGLPHLRAFLKKVGLVPQELERINSVDLMNRDFANRILQAMMEHADDIEKTAPVLDIAVETAEEWANTFERVTSATPPTLDLNQPADLLLGETQKLVRRQKVLQQIIDSVSQVEPSATRLTPEQWAKVEGYLRDLEPRMTATRLLAKQMGTNYADFALHNYGDKHNFDLGLAMLFNFPTWHSRNMTNMLIRAMETPGRMAALGHLRSEVVRMNRNLPEWWQDQIPMKFGGNDVYLPLLSMFDPTSSFFGDKFRDPDLSNSPLGAVLSEAQQYGPGLHPWISTMMAGLASINHHPDEAQGWLGYVGTATKGINALTVLAKEVGAPGIPAGGITLEPWLWGMQNGSITPFQGPGSKWEAKRIGMALMDMTDKGEITQAQMYDVLENQSGPLYERAIQRSKEMTAIQNVASWFFGAGIKPRPEIEIQVQQMDMDTRNLYASQAEMSPEAYRQAWAALREKYPFADAVRAFRKDDTERQEIYAWSVFDRLPPNPEPYFTAMGLDAKLYSGYMDKFYTGKGLSESIDLTQQRIKDPSVYKAGQRTTITDASGNPQQVWVVSVDGAHKRVSVSTMSPLERQDFMNMMRQMGAILAMPIDATQAEWEQARASRKGMFSRLDTEFPNASTLQDQYYFVQQNQGNEAAKAFLDQHGELEAYWNRKDQIVTGDAVLSRYYGSMDMFERVAKDQFEAEQEQAHPGLHETLAAYYALLDAGDSKASSTFRKDHPEVAAYARSKDQWTLHLDDELNTLTASVRGLEPAFATLRQDADLTTMSQDNVAALIQSGSRPLGEFELPETLDARQVRSGIREEVAALEESGMSRSAIYNQLKRMGYLDDVLVTLTEIGSDTAAINLIDAQLPKFQALLTALASIHEGHGGAPSGTGTGNSSGSSGDYSGGRSFPSARKPMRPQPAAPREHIRSTRWGGASSAPQTQAAETQQNAQMNEVLASIQSSSPLMFGSLRNLADLTDPAAAAAFLDQPANAHFKTWLTSVLQSGLDLKALLAALKAMLSQPATSSTRRGSSYRFGQNSYTTRYSNPRLRR